MGRPRVVVGGFLGLLPVGGISWHYVQYPAGLAALGCDVFYIEDTSLWPVYQTGDSECGDCSRNVAHLAEVMDAFGFRDRWAYRDEPSGQWFGMSEAQVQAVCRSADIFLNVSCSAVMRDDYMTIPVRALVDTDPMFTQVQHETEVALTHGEPAMRQMVDAHTHHFTFGENVGAGDCRIPSCGRHWIPTRQPVCLQHWPVTPLPASGGAAYTTVMNYSAAAPLAYAGETWGQKDVEFARFMGVPEALPGIPFAIAVGQTGGRPFPADDMRGHGWQLLDPMACAPDWRSYRAFIGESRGEFSVAKETYVKARTGWFSERSACYLASGRPVIAQDTGWTRCLPSDCGLMGFDDFDSATEALRQVSAEPQKHARAARAVAEEHFGSDIVLGKLLQELGS